MRLIIILSLFFITQLTNAQTIFGKWKAIDKNDVEKCIVEIYKENDKVYGKIVEVLVEKDKNALCEKCTGNDKNKPILGLVIIKDLEKEGDFYLNGTIFDPEKGNSFNCRITLETEDVLQVRGYISFLYETQYWKRV